MIVLTLIKKTARYFFSKMDLFRNKELQIRTRGLMANHRQLQKNKEEERSCVDLKRAVVKEESIEED